MTAFFLRLFGVLFLFHFLFVCVCTTQTSKSNGCDQAREDEEHQALFHSRKFLLHKSYSKNLSIYPFFDERWKIVDEERGFTQRRKDRRKRKGRSACRISLRLGDSFAPLREISMFSNRFLVTIFLNPKILFMQMRKLLTEFIGTFFLVTVVGMTVIGGKGDFAPIAIGTVLMCMVFAGAHVSGAHYNPAVTLAVLLRGRIKLSEGIAYIIVQVIGGIAAAFLVRYILADKAPETATAMADTTRALIAEILGTFALAYVVLNVATAKGTTGNMFYGLSIGFTVLCMAYAFGSISGGAFNPAVATGVTFMRLAAWSDFWVYLGGCFGGGALAAVVFKIINPDDK